MLSTSSSVSAKSLLHRLKMIADYPYSDIVQQWNIPSLYIQAKHDKLVPEYCLDWYQKYMTQLQVVQIDGGHFLLHTRTSQVMDAVEGFVNSIANDNIS